MTRQRYSEELIQKAIQMRESGVKFNQIVADTGMNRHGLSCIFRRLGVKSLSVGRPKPDSSLLKEISDRRGRGESPESIATALNLKYRTVIEYCRKGGFLAKKVASRQDKVQKIQFLLLAGHTLPQIAEQTGCSTAYACKTAKKLGIAITPVHKPVTLDLIEIIRENYSQNYHNRKTRYELASELNLSPNTIKNILKKSGLRLTQEQLQKYTKEDIIVAAEKLRFSITKDFSSVRTDSNVLVNCHCGREFPTRVDSLARGAVKSCGCIKSLPQLEIFQFIESLGFSPRFDDWTQLKKMELDIWIPEARVAVEMCGLYWHGEVNNGSKAVSKHYKKWKTCTEKGIRLITVWECEWTDHKETVKNFLRSILKKGESKAVGARQCEVRGVSRAVASEFLEANHIQGQGIGGHYGLFLEDKLVSLMSVSKIKNDPGAMSIERYCVQNGFSVSGGFMKLIAHVRNKFNPTKLVSFSDNRWSEGGVYERGGFEHISDVRPNYWYFQNEGAIEHKSKFRKNKIEDIKDDETEWEAMRRNGWDRIWDCGKKKWVLKCK
jgi:DNA-binding CsgD family transcriptional regulator